MRNTTIQAMTAIVTLAMLTWLCAATEALASYTVNGQPVAPEMQQLLAFQGFKPGDYYIDAQGNYGVKGQPPMANFNGGPPRNWNGVEPTSADNAYARAYVNGVSKARMFWVYSPSIFSGATGGSSGYVHICPDNVFHRSSEGSISVGGEYNSEFGKNESWAGVAGTYRGSGRWGVEGGPNGPTLALYGPDGGVQRIALQTMLRGRWKFGQTKYAVEPGKASCR